jgi:hypothetical protein
MNCPHATLLLLLASCCTLRMQAQAVRPPFHPTLDQQSPPRVAYLRATVGTTATLDWAYTCSRIALEYAPMLGPRFGLAGRVAGVTGHPTAATPLYGPWIETIPNQNYRAGFLEGEALYYPFGSSHRVRFALGLGAFFGTYKHNSVDTIFVVNNQVTHYHLASRNGSQAGYIASANLEVGVGQQQRWLVGLKVTRQQGTGKIDNLPSQGLTLARKL